VIIFLGFVLGNLKQFGCLVMVYMLTYRLINNLKYMMILIL